MPARLLAALPMAAALLAQSAPEPASVAGVVTNSITGEPVTRAHVTVTCPSSGPQKGMQGYGALANAKGEFSISPLPFGECWVTAQRIGFVSMGPNERVSLSAGTHKEAIKLKLVPAGAITGRVVNAAGEPCPGVVVLAEGVYPGSIMADDQGQFRLGGLPPGRYRVKATKETLPFPPEIRADGSVEVYDADTYYPNSLSAKTAQWLEVRAGAEVTGIEVRMVRTPVVGISGKVTGMPAGVKNVGVNLVPNGRGTGVRPDGTFTIWRIPPGKYSLHAQQWSGQASLRSAPVEIEVTTANLENLELPMIPPFEIAGQLRFDDDQAKQPPRPPTRADGTTPQAPPPPPHVELHPIIQMFGESFGSPIAADDSFAIDNIAPGRYRVSTSGMTGFVKSLRAGDTETEGNILDVSNGSRGPVTLTLSSNFAEISGTASDFKGPAADVRIALVGEGTDFQVTNSDASGSYRFRAAPGKYKLVLTGDGNPFMGLQAGGGMSDLEGEPIEVNAGDKLRKDLARKE